MKKPSKFAFGFAFLVAALLTACGGDDNGLDDIQPTPDGDIVLPKADAAPCDIATQNCEASTDKCTVALDDQNNWLPSVCRTAGAVAIGETCTREAAGAAGVGRDNCIAGGYCTAFGSSDNSDTPKYCRQFCRSSANCPTQGQQCFPFPNYMLSPVEGVCITSCTVFDNTGCTGGTWCAPTSDTDMALMGTCAIPGTAALGGACGDVAGDGMNVGCGAGLICVVQGSGAATGTCTALCDIAATKAKCTVANETCQVLNGLPTTVGVCRPMMMKPGSPGLWALPNTSAM